MLSERLYAVIMAGGVGTRFWPASRRLLPKQFLPIGSRRALIVETAARLQGLVPLERTLVVAGREHAPLVRRSLKRLPPENLLSEPCGRNTAACVAWAAAEIERRAPHSVQIVLPSDHVIRPAKEFRRALLAAAEEADHSRALVTLGIRPTFAATGYGYIECGEPTAERGGFAVHAVARFVEKPDAERARQFLESGTFLWNAGIFVWRTDAILSELERHAPQIAGGARAIRTDADVERVYPTLPSLPIDVAVMEKTEHARVVPIRFAWSDVGSWTALPDIQPLDEAGNCVTGGAKLVGEDASGCIVYGKSGELVALIGVHDLVVVRAGRALLVVPRARAQEVKRIVARLEREDPSFL